MNILIFDDYTSMHDTNLIIETIFLRFDLPKVDITILSKYHIVASIVSTFHFQAEN